MAKGNIFMGTLKGRVGASVFYVKQGEQNQIKYQDQVSNPQTNRQMYQRARFANAGRFFTRGNRAMFKFAFEGKRPGVSDFNGFMAANINRSVLISRSALANETYPAIGKFIMSKGSLSPVTCRVVNDYWQGTFGELSYSTLPATVAELSSLLIATGNYQQGDILTFVYINTQLTETIPSITPTGDFQTQWLIKQFIVDVNDNTLLSAYEMRAVTRVWDGATYLTLTDLEDSQILNNDYAGFTCVHSRNTASGLKVSTQELALGEGASEAYDACQTEEYIATVIANWKSTDTVGVPAEAVLQGAIAQSRAAAPVFRLRAPEPEEGSINPIISGVNVSFDKALSRGALAIFAIIPPAGVEANDLEVTRASGTASTNMIGFLESEEKIDVVVQNSASQENPEGTSVFRITYGDVLVANVTVNLLAS